MEIAKRLRHEQCVELVSTSPFELCQDRAGAALPELRFTGLVCIGGPLGLRGPSLPGVKRVAWTFTGGAVS